MLKYFYLVISLLLITFPTQGKVLDIIIGGDMGQGLECHEDMDCPGEQFCHEEQYHCVMCKVPPYEWTGTECKCPAGTVEKDNKTCVECLENTDCVNNYFCDTDTNHCEYCIFPKLWVNNLCKCPPETNETDGVCVCNQTNTELNQTTGKCDCILSEEKCASTNFNSNECLCCPTSQPVYNGTSCVTCATFNPNKPIWDAASKKCIQCRTNTDCAGSTPICNASSKVCESCPSDKPVWDANSKTCVKQVTITWQNASNKNSQTVTSNQNVYSQNPGSIEGYNFDGWYWDRDLSNRVNFPVKVNSDTTFYARWNGLSATSDEIPINKCGGSRLGSEYTHTQWEYWVPKNAIVQVYARSSWNDDGYNCNAKSGNWYFNWYDNNRNFIQNGWEQGTHCTWVYIGNAPSNILRLQSTDWSKHCDVVFRLLVRYEMPAIRY